MFVAPTTKGRARVGGVLSSDLVARAPAAAREASADASLGPEKALKTREVLAFVRH